jgi:predicted RNA binding protein YcfA (HicA-like mRNA interferase family)
MKVREIINIITKDGWFEVRQRGSHKQYKHSVKKGLVTIACHKMSDDTG